LLTYVEEVHAGTLESIRTSAHRFCGSNEIEEQLNAEMQKVVIEQQKAISAKLEAYERERFLSPVLDIVASLPKDELAAMAESLVNLTSFQRRISREVETVGGPIDVAIISKGDGFIWIKRKHYFEKDLNPAFFANYYAEGGKKLDG
jgi:hypothetical protein